MKRFQRYFLVGLLTVAPLGVTWLVFEFLVALLVRAGAPWVPAASRAVRPFSGEIADWLLAPGFQSLVAVVLVIGGLIGLGWMASRVFGRRLLEAMEALIRRLPLVDAVYGSTRRLLSALSERPQGVQRVVLIPFPSSDMKVVGLVTRTLKDRETGRTLAAVYVPTSPNPTSGYVEIVPLEHVVETDWSIDEAMRFVVTGGASAPEQVSYGIRREAPPDRV
ncbi:MAG: DUF502 domain-containing protein [Gammaproteobacteria bacterium]|jgi:uncharacterized membrane protein|nr:DUF502 domain-containing protein [Gammaproteobacteria bacterium]